MPGSNPLFGLNTLGGALSLETKNGVRDPGTSIQAIYGSHTRRAVEFEHGGSTAGGGLHWYVAGNLFDENGLARGFAVAASASCSASSDGSGRGPTRA